MTAEAEPAVARIIDLRNTHLLSTGALCKKLGLQLNSQYIIDLGVLPQVRGPVGLYWAPGQLREIRRALISRLIDAEFADGKEQTP